MRFGLVFEIELVQINNSIKTLKEGRNIEMKRRMITIKEGSTAELNNPTGVLEDLEGV